MSAEISRMATRIQGFADPEMEFQFLRALGVTPSGGGALGECLAVRAGMAAEDTASWVSGWTALARQCLDEARRCLQGGHRVSARDLFLRASMYFRGAEYFADITSPQHRELGLASQDAFQEACPLGQPPVEIITIPFESTPLPGYFAPAPGVTGPNQTLIICGGFDSSGEELHLNFGVEALKRGLHVLIFEGPGQTGMLRLNPDLPFRRDWEAVVGPVVDHALGRPEVDPARLALMGISLGGNFAMRAAAHEPRLGALILNSPVLSLHDYLAAFAPGALEGPDFSRQEVRDMGPAEMTPSLRANTLQLFQRFGGPQCASFHRLFKIIQGFDVSGEMLAAITCPTLACLGQGEGEEPRRQWRAFGEQAGGPVTLHEFGAAWGADSHCQVGNIARLGQVTFDWLSDVFKAQGLR